MLRRAVLLGGVLLASAGLPADDPPLPAASDLRALGARSAQLKAPIVLLLSTPGCPYCREVRRNYLAPQWAEQKTRAGPQLLFVEIEITSAQPLIDFDGSATTQAAYAARHGIDVVPVVLVVDSRGRPLAEPLVGLDRSGFYDSYLQSRFDEARKRYGGR